MTQSPYDKLDNLIGQRKQEENNKRLQAQKDEEQKKALRAANAAYVKETLAPILTEIEENLKQREISINIEQKTSDNVLVHISVPRELKRGSTVNPRVQFLVDTKEQKITAYEQVDHSGRSSPIVFAFGENVKSAVENVMITAVSVLVQGR